MNRPIKFRAWDNEQKFMLMPESDVLVISTNGVAIDSEEFAVMQFTGLTDKNGKEIYEGDILSAGDEYGPWAIQWDEKLLMWKVKDGGMLWALRKDAEVIGNIYENPELLTN